MKLSEDFFYTLREDVSDEDSVSGKLLVKSGMIKKVSNGVYAKTPLGTKAFQNKIALISASITARPVRADRKKENIHAEIRL
jgi:prolyl-tRNA synthetase